MPDVGIPLSRWSPAHSALIQFDESGRLIFLDTAQLDYHLIRITDEGYRNKRIRLNIVSKPTSTCTVELYVNHWGGIDVCRISQHGDIIDRGIADDVSVTVDESGYFCVTVIFFNTHDTLSLGTSHGPGGVYLGRGRDEYLFKQITITVEELEAVDEADRICLIDVGAAGGIQEKWRAVREYVRPILFEPNPADAAVLRQELSSYAGAAVIETGLFSQDTMRTLYVTRVPGCSSLFRPLPDRLARYAIAPAFEVIKEIPVACSRYDSLFARGEVPQPDVIKIDVQGVELEVLYGFGSLLTNCIAIELEAQVYPIYEGQALLGEIVAYLDRFEFALRKLEPQMNFDGDVVEFNAYFVNRFSKPANWSIHSQRKIEILSRVWNLASSSAGRQIADSIPIRKQIN